MSDLSGELHLPPDPAQPSGAVAPTETWQGAAKQIGADAGQVVQTPTVNTPVPPTVVTDASGVSHVVIPLTKKTKAYIGTALGAASLLGSDVTLLTVPDSVKLWAAGVVLVVGVIATFFGIVLPTNLPVRSDKV